MTESTTYNVLLSGNLKSGFEPEQVVEAFARLFKLSPEKAGAIIGKRFVVKREVELNVAKAYRDKLVAIGIDVKLKPHGDADELELEPVEQPLSKDGVPLEAGEMICPKCELKQTRAEECSGCGVIIEKAHKVQEQIAEAEAENPEPPTASTPAAAGDANSDQPASKKWLIAAAAVVAAVLAALLWYLFAV